MPLRVDAGQSRSVAQEWFDAADALTEWTDRWLVNRRDVFGHYIAVEKRDPESKSTAITDKKRLTSANLILHYRGGSTGDVIGLHSTKRDDATGEGEVPACYCRWIAIDIDRHDDETDPEATWRAALAFYERAVALGFRPLLFDSNGRGGYHLIILFDGPIPSEAAHAFGRWLRRDWNELGLDADPEVFPKQPSIGQGGFGNWLRLPGRHHTRDHFSQVWDGSAWLAGKGAIDYLLATEGTPRNCIPPEALEVDKPIRKVRRDSPEIDHDKDGRLAKEALRYLDPNDYDLWIKIGMCLTVLGRSGMSIWEEWSSRSEKYGDGDCDRKWKTFRRPDGVTLGTLFELAKQHGFEFPRRSVKVSGKTASGSPPLKIAEVGTGIEPGRPASSGRRRKEYHKTDLGNAERMVDLYGHRLHYVHPWKKWLIWDGKRWKVDDTAAIGRAAKKTIRSIYADAKGEGDDSPRKDLAKWAMESESRKALNDMVTVASSEPGIPTLPNQLDQHPWLLNCQNGTIDLKTGRLRPHDPADMLTKMCPVDYDPDAESALWIETLMLFFDGNRDLISFWQRLCGYALTGLTEEHILPIAYGEGSNGKSTILGAFLDVLGTDYAMKSAQDLLIAKKIEGHSTERMDLFGMRIVVGIETDEGDRLNEPKIKEFTGGDKIRGRRMREDPWEFTPTHTVFLATNHKPQIRGTDHAIWRRLKLIPFAVKMPDDKAKKKVPNLLKEERAGILAWMVRGCLEWQKDGLNVPEEVAKATEKYRTEEDLLGGFLLERCNSFLDHSTLKAEAKESKDVLYQAYVDWAKSSLGETILTGRKFGSEMERRGYQLKQSNGKSYRLGIQLIAGNSESEK